MSAQLDLDDVVAGNPKATAQLGDLRYRVCKYEAVLRMHYGYAKGNYSCTCIRCDDHHVADKRSRICKTCADKYISEEIERLV